MLIALLRWLDQASGWLHPAADGDLCIAVAGPASAAGEVRPRYWGHVPLSQVSVLHGVH